METERKRGRGPAVPPGPTAMRVAENIKAVRKERGLLLDDLRERLSELGQPASKSGLSKIESGHRRVDVDELVALAIALETNPNRLLLSPDGDSTELDLTPTSAWSALSAWAWACGELPNAPWVWAKFVDVEIERDGVKRTLAAPGQRFQQETRPHNPPIYLSAEETARLDPLRQAFDNLFFGMREHDFTAEDFQTVVGMYAHTTWQSHG